MKKITKTDKKVSGLKRNRVVGIPTIKHGTPQPGITGGEFMGILKRAVKPDEHVSESDSGSSQT